MELGSFILEAEAAVGIRTRASLSPFGVSFVLCLLALRNNLNGNERRRRGSDARSVFVAARAVDR